MLPPTTPFLVLVPPPAETASGSEEFHGRRKSTSFFCSDCRKSGRVIGEVSLETSSKHEHLLKLLVMLRSIFSAVVIRIAAAVDLAFSISPLIRFLQIRSMTAAHNLRHHNSRHQWRRNQISPSSDSQYRNQAAFRRLRSTHWQSITNRLRVR
uniref:Uncharacterized protein n=1 Tax=Opuntia streptacantha TaxID=393608 RepID=A0A7C9D3B3_OPUST